MDTVELAALEPATTAKLAGIVSALAATPTLCDSIPPPGTSNGRRTPAPCRSAAPSAGMVEHYGGVDIHSLVLPNSTVSPAYAVIGGNALLGTSTAAVRHAVDTHNGAPAITAASLFKSSPASGATGGLLFVDAQHVLSAIESSLSSSEKAGFDKDALPYLRALPTVAVTGSQSAAEQHTHTVVTVG
ncbi:MAG TPA: hypothetical protein VGQ42_13570 [Candidatus Dormibacteraeota bacterium]|jgi:hypothetical protein|nr:hypothetical protein [Candidatus Dormibacteraeota bacterium]